MQENLSGSNSTGSDPSMFFLSGIPGLEAMHIWISIPFCSMLIVAFLGNCTLLYVIKAEPSLHKPMFYFLAMLAFIDLVSCTTTTPKTLSIFWFNSREISFNACLVQMFFLHSSFDMESGVLVAMAFDRYVAICNPLRYTSILTNSVIAKIGLAALARTVLISVPVFFLLSRLPFCQSHIISHCYCEHLAVLKLACGNTWFNNIFGIFATLFTVGLDLMLITLSYLKILKTVLCLVSKEEQLKAIGTCVSHICAIFMVYIPVVLTSILHSVYFVFPPMMNPIVYGVKTKQIRDRVHLLFRGKNF
uniref:Olfactory receptor n=1 Tax=Pelusios castaneus TaxID=367368 RepID=A0A8C8S571_9SAUR